MTNKNNTKEIRFKVSPANFERLKSEADNHGLDMPNYMRYLSSALMAGDYLPDAEARQELLKTSAKLAGVCNNLNQLTHQINGDVLRGSVSVDTVMKLGELLHKVGKAVQMANTSVSHYYSPFDDVIAKSDAVNSDNAEASDA